MKRLLRFTLLNVAIVLLGSATLARGAESAGSGSLEPLFNGKDFAGWQVPEPNPFWKTSDGVLIGENDEKKKGHVLYTQKSYGNFVMETEARWSGEIDSGIMLRKPELQLQIGGQRTHVRDPASQVLAPLVRERARALLAAQLALNIPAGIGWARP